MTESPNQDIIKFNFTGRNVLVTGGTSCIGAAIAHAYLAAGANVTISGTNDSIKAYTPSPPQRSKYIQFNLSSLRDVEIIVSHLPQLDILINNAGGTTVPEEFANAVQSNLIGTEMLTTALKPALARSTMPGGASVINILSSMSFFGSSSFPGYGAAKAGLHMLTKSLATTYASENIRVNAVAPGPVRTRMTEVYADSAEYGPSTAARIALGRWGLPEDIAPPVLFLTSPSASFITGECLTVSGGYLISEG